MKKKALGLGDTLEILLAHNNISKLSYIDAETNEENKLSQALIIPV